MSVDPTHIKDFTPELLKEGKEFMPYERMAYLKVLDAALRAVGFGVWRWNLETNEVAWDANMFKVFGQNPETFDPTYENFFNLLIPEDRRRVDTDVRQAIKAKSDWMNAFRVIKANGDIAYIRAYGKVYNGEPYMAGIDIPISQKDFFDTQTGDPDRYTGKIVCEERRKMWMLRQKVAQVLSIDTELEIQPPEGFEWTGFGELMPGARWRRINGAIDEDLIIEFEANNDCLEMHYHNFDETIICRHGKMKVNVEGEKYTIQSGQSLHIPAYRYHEACFENDSTCLVIWHDFYKIDKPLVFVSKN